MKKLFFLLLMMPFFLQAQNDTGKSFKLRGKIGKLAYEPEWVFISYKTGGDYKTDSSKLANGKFSFAGKIQEPQLARLRVKYKSTDGKAIPTNYKRDMVSVFLEPGKVKVMSIDSFSNVTVKGSEVHKEFAKLQKQTKPFEERLEPLYKKYTEYNKAKDIANRDKTEKEIDDIDAERSEAVYGTYVKNNPSSPAVMYALNMYAGWDINADKIEPVYNSLPASTKEWPSAIEFKEKIEIAKKTGIGRIAMDFTQNDTLGKPVTLSSLKGRYLLVDFWASWCGPCRAENPNVVKAFNKYKDKGFHIIGVSLDNPGQMEKWMKAIHDDGLIWTQLSDLKGWKNEVAVQYGIQAIPQNFLLDPEGKIIAKNLRGEELDSKLSEIVEKKGF